MAGTMTTEQVREYLDSRPGFAVLTTIGRDGLPHSVPLGFFRHGDAVVFGGRPGTQRAANIERNDAVSVVVHTGSTMQDIKGVLIQGRAEVVTDPAEVLELARHSARRRGTAEDDLPTEASVGAQYLRVRPVRTISWDYGT